MQPVWSWAVALIAAYLLGSLCFSILVSRLMERIDIRDYGSNNAGATNVLRVMGPKAAALVFLGDGVKGCGAVLLGQALGGESLAWLCALASVLGHCFPIFFRLKGGKGVSTMAGAVITLDGSLSLLLAAVFFVLLLLTRRVSVGSLALAALLPVTFSLFYGFLIPQWAACLGMGLLMVFQHRQNLIRIVQGTEPKISFHRRRKE